jgi:hypothetical protein
MPSVIPSSVDAHAGLATRVWQTLFVHQPHARRAEWPHGRLAASPCVPSNGRVRVRRWRRAWSSSTLYCKQTRLHRCPGWLLQLPWRIDSLNKDQTATRTQDLLPEARLLASKGNERVARAPTVLLEAQATRVLPPPHARPLPLARAPAIIARCHYRLGAAYSRPPTA